MEMLELAEKNIKTIFITIVHMHKNLRRGMKGVKIPQIEFLKLKTRSNEKILDENKCIITFIDGKNCEHEII